MNLKEMMQAMRAKLDAAKAAEDIEAKKTLMDEYDAMKKEYDLALSIEEAEKSFVAEKTEPVAAKESEEEAAIKSFAAAARQRFAKTMTEGTNADGGYTVPEAISTKIEHLRDAKFSLRKLVSVKKVNTMSGQETYLARASKNGFASVSEGGDIQAIAAPQFQRISWQAVKYAGYLPVTNELLADTDANLTGEIVNWFADQERVTDNKKILAVLDSKYTRSSSPETAETISGIDSIKNVLNVKLGQAFKGTACVITNDDGLQWLDTLKDEEGRYLLSADPTDPMKLRLAAGATTVPLVIVPNSDLATDTTYGVPFYIGDMKESVRIYDRAKLSIMSSNIAAIGSLNAFEEDLTIYRGIVRADYKAVDEKAWYKGFYLAS